LLRVTRMRLMAWEPLRPGPQAPSQVWAHSLAWVETAKA
jgi:hypothetical protein